MIVLLSSPNIEQMYKNKTKQPNLLEDNLHDTVSKFRRLVDANEAARECECSVDLVYKILNGVRKDYYGILQFYYDRISEKLDLKSVVESNNSEKSI